MTDTSFRHVISDKNKALASYVTFIGYIEVALFGYSDSRNNS